MIILIMSDIIKMFRVYKGGLPEALPTSASSQSFCVRLLSNVIRFEETTPQKYCSIYIRYNFLIIPKQVKNKFAFYICIVVVIMSLPA